MSRPTVEKAIMALLLAVALVGLASAVKIIRDRHEFENRQNKVALVLDFPSLQKLARQSGQSESWWLEKLEGLGYQDLAIEEDTVESLQDGGLLQSVPGYELNAWRDLGLWQDQHPINQSRVYLMSQHKELLDRIEAGFNKRFMKSWQRFLAEKPMGGTADILEVPATAWDGVGKMGFGFGAETISPAMRKFRLYPRINNTLMSPDMLAFKLGTLKTMPAQGCLIFSGIEVPGFPGDLKDSAEQFSELEHGLCLAELVEMDGLIEFKGLFKGSKKLHSITEEEMRRFNENRFVQRFSRAATERDIRILFVRALTFAPKSQLESSNLRYFKRVIQTVKKQGFQVGVPSDFKGFAPPALSQKLCLLGLWCLTLICFLMLISEKFRPIVGAGGLLLGIMVIGVGSGISQQMLVALFAMILLAGLPSLYFGLNPNFLQAGLSRPWVAWGGMSLLSLAGGLMVAATFSISSTFNGDIIFKGPKASLFLPIFITALGWMIETGKGNSFSEKIQDFFRQPLQKGEVIGAVILLLAALVMVMRSGNETDMVSSFELVFRDKLEILFGVRPRTKEFLFGHPFAIAGFTLFALGRRGLLPWAFLVFGTMAQASILNTYCHFHTPIILSVTRSIFGIAVGAGLGFGLTIVCVLGEKLWARRNVRS